MHRDDGFLVFIIVICIVFLIGGFIWHFKIKKNERLKMGIINLGIFIIGSILLGLIWVGTPIKMYLENPQAANQYVFPFNILFHLFMLAIFIGGIWLIGFGVRNVYRAFKNKSLINF